MRLVAIALLVLLLVGCATVPKELYSDSNPRLEFAGIQQPLSWLVVAFFLDKETGKMIEVAVNTITGAMSVVEVR